MMVQAGNEWIGSPGTRVDTAHGRQAFSLASGQVVQHTLCPPIPQGTSSQLLLLWSTALSHGSYPSRSYALILITTATTIND